ncbi:hypothetical protein [Eleftheria terrae]|uniref:hypothetical protein n=1 Tax=Eleftheria terrae TaxID=1597781 RepID=UPI00263A3E70|nr:hypothetical protein [Eleftheria terrae]WKB53382.1 hypothetical protein N7L95_03000 [Eleftheria terrae]
MKPEDILPDTASHVQAGGHHVRKGSVGAFIANARRIADASSTPAERAAAEADLLALLPGLQALGLFDVFAVQPGPVRTLVERWQQAQGALPPR